MHACKRVAVIGATHLRALHALACAMRACALPPQLAALCHAVLRCAVQLAMLRTILREQGMAGLWAGLRPRVLFHIPAAAVCWGTYESMKDMLGASS